MLKKMSISQSAALFQDYIFKAPIDIGEIKENIVKFLNTKNLLKDLEKNCIYFYDKSINNQTTALILNLQLNYNDIPEGKLINRCEKNG